MRDLLDFLAKHGIEYRRVDHPAVYTAAEARDLVPELPGAEIKNLFLRDGKGKRHFLVAVPGESKVDLKKLGGLLEAGHLGFASADRLKRILGLEPGAVSLLAAINDRGAAVEVVVDRRLQDYDAFQCHPLVNTSTLLVRRSDVEKFQRLCGHEPRWLDVPAADGGC